MSITIKDAILSNGSDDLLLKRLVEALEYRIPNIMAIEVEDDNHYSEHICHSAALSEMESVEEKLANSGLAVEEISISLPAEGEDNKPTPLGLIIRRDLMEKKFLTLDMMYGSKHFGRLFSNYPEDPAGWAPSSSMLLEDKARRVNLSLEFINSASVVSAMPCVKHMNFYHPK